MKRLMREQQADVTYEITWTTLGESLETLARRGVSCNVASFVGATTVRIHELGYEDRRPTDAELERMWRLVRQAMKEGALGVGSSLIYAPAFYASTEELIELCKVAAEYHGTYISHLRSEGNRLLEGVDELIRKVEEARAAGVRISTDMYTYTAGATGLDAAMPPWVQEGGLAAWRQRLRDAAIRRRLKREMATPTDEWENLLLAAGTPENVLLIELKNPPSSR